MRASRVWVLAATAALAAVPLLLGGAAHAQDPCEISRELPICTPSEDPTEEPTPEPSPDPTSEPTSGPTSQPSPSPEPSPEPEPSVAPSEEPSEDETFEPFEGSGTPPIVGTGDAPSGGSTDGGEAPQVFDPAQSGGPGTGGTRPFVLVGVDDVAAALPGVFGIGLLTALLGVGTMLGTRGLLRRGGLTAQAPDGGTDVERTRRTRMMLGVALLAAAAVAGIVGYLKISLEPVVAVQVVYLASAGFAVVLLAIAGGSLIVSDQLRADEHRISQLEAALASVAEHVRPAVQDPPRLLDRSGDEE